MRALLDANVVVGLLFAETGSISRLRQWARTSEYQPVISSYILGEVADVWAEPYWRRHLTLGEIPTLLSAIHEIFEVIDVASVIPGVAPHAEDDAILAAGVAGRVDAIVTGDRQMLDRRSYEGTGIVTPRQFVDLLATP